MDNLSSTEMATIQYRKDITSLKEENEKLNKSRDAWMETADERHQDIKKLEDEIAIYQKKDEIREARRAGARDRRIAYQLRDENETLKEKVENSRSCRIAIQEENIKLKEDNKAMEIRQIGQLAVKEEIMRNLDIIADDRDRAQAGEKDLRRMCAEYQDEKEKLEETK